MSISNYNSWNRCAKSYRAVARRPYTSQRKSENDPLLFPAVLKIIGYSVSNFKVPNMHCYCDANSSQYYVYSQLISIYCTYYDFLIYSIIIFYTHHDRVWIAMPKTKTWTRLNVFLFVYSLQNIS